MNLPAILVPENFIETSPFFTSSIDTGFSKVIVPSSALKMAS